MAEQRDIELEDRPVPSAVGEATEREEAPERDSALVPADSLQRYLAEIRRIPVLSREEEHELAVRWQEHGDRRAAWKLVTSNLRLVVLVAPEDQRALHNLLDLIQESNVGLLEAGKKIDPYPRHPLPPYPG